MGILSYLITALLYGLLALHFWRLQAAPLASSAGALRHPGGAATSWALLAPIVLHAYSIGVAVHGADGLYLGVGTAVSAIVWVTVLVYWIGHLVYGLEGLQALVTPVAAVASLLPVVIPASHPLPNTEFPLFRAHLLIAMLAYSLFTIAALHALIMSAAEKRLHHPGRGGWLRGFPPLLTMETLLFRIITAGFVLLTLTLASGIVFSEEVFGKPLTFSHKTVFGTISWMIYAALLAGRHFRGWRGRTAVRWTVAGFIALLLAYVGTKFVLEVILQR